MSKTMTRSLFFLSIALAATAAVAGSDAWPHWRGPHASGAASAGNPPVEWSEKENVRWKLSVPGLGSSTPIVWGDRVYISTAIEQEGGNVDFMVMAVARKDGTEVWRRVVHSEKPHEGTHQDGTYASGSPITDGERLYAYFGSRGLYALDLEKGNILWQRDFGDMNKRLGFGEGSSPAVHDGKLVVQWDHEGPSALIAVDAETGKDLWRAERQEDTTWATPLIVDTEAGAQVITAATSRVRSYALESGELIWEAPGLTLNAIPSPVYDDGVVYLMSGFRGNKLLAVRLDGAKGEIDADKQVTWTLERSTPYVPSPLLADGTLYFLKSNSAILSAYDAKSGREIFAEQRLPGLRSVYASPVAVSDRLYIVGRDGGAVVLKKGDKIEVLAENQLDDGFDASPAIADDELYLRGRQSLYCIAAD